MSEMLGHFVTECARVTAYTDHVLVVSASGKHRLVVHGQIAQNIYGNQECFLALVSVDETIRLVGSTASEESDGKEGKSFSDFVVERADEGLYRIRYSGDLGEDTGVVLEEDGLNALLKACRLYLGHNRFEYDDDFWVVKATYETDEISISPLIFEILPEKGPRITISRDSMSEWMEIFAAIEDIESFLKGSMIKVRDFCEIFCKEDKQLYVKITTGERVVGLMGSTGFFSICRRLMGIVWLGEDPFEEEIGVYDDEEEDEYDV